MVEGSFKHRHGSLFRFTLEQGTCVIVHVVKKLENFPCLTRISLLEPNKETEHFDPSNPKSDQHQQERIIAPNLSL